MVQQMFHHPPFPLENIHDLIEKSTEMYNISQRLEMESDKHATVG